MKKYILMGGVLLFSFALSANFTFAVVNAVTPSTNDINRTNGWAHVDQLSQGVGTTDLQFTSTRAFWSCFEYRTDGNTSQVISENGGVNYNTNISDGLYPYYCENNSNETKTIAANQYVEVRMVFGAETDERFDWTRFDVLPPPLDTTAPSIPTNGQPNDTCLPTNNFDFTWDASTDDSSDPITYEFQSSLNPAQTDGVLTTGLWQSETLPNNMIHSSGAPDGTWNWQVRAKDQAGNYSDWSQIWTVTLDHNAPSVPNLVSPANDSIVTTSNFQFDWSDSTDQNNVSYEWQSSYDPAFGSVLVDHTGLTNSSIDSPGTPDNTYYWHVRAIDCAGNMSEWSDVWKVTVNTQPVVVGPPTDKDQCKHDGWKTFNNPVFKNQGECVSYVANGKAKVKTQVVDIYHVNNGDSDQVDSSNPYKGKVVLTSNKRNAGLIVGGFIKDLKPNTKYFFWVRNLDSNGGYTGKSLFSYSPLGYYKLMSFKTNRFGGGMFGYRIRKSALPAGTYDIQVAINDETGSSNHIGSTVAATEKYASVVIGN